MEKDECSSACSDTKEEHGVPTAAAAAAATTSQELLSSTTMEQNQADAPQLQHSPACLTSSSSKDDDDDDEHDDAVPTADTTTAATVTVTRRELAGAILMEQEKEHYASSVNNNVEASLNEKVQKDTADASTESDDEEQGITTPAAVVNTTSRSASADFDVSYRASFSVSRAASAAQQDKILLRWRPWASWSRDRVRTTVAGCFSSCVVLVIRLLLDKEPTAYVIHSYIILFDMLLIHLFTNCRWLGISGEVTTVIFFLAFHFTKETVWELLETTIIAALCSFHLITSRNKHRDREEELSAGMDNVIMDSLHHQQSLQLMLCNNSIRGVDDEETDEAELGGATNGETSNGDFGVTDVSEAQRGFFSGRNHSLYRRRVFGCGERFFEQFLDGSAGVMYTSFLGLIIDELITYGDSSNK